MGISGFRRTYAWVAGLTIMVSTIALAGDVKIIANASIRTDSISSSELRSVYLLQRKALNDGSRVEPVLQKAGAAHEAFLNQYLGRTKDDIRDYYRGLVFTGKGWMPKEVTSDAEMVAYVAATKGALGYVNAASPTDGVKTLVVLGEVGNNERTLLVRVDPEYPETLLKLGIYIKGTVSLQLTVSPQGRVESAILVAGNPALGEAAIQAARQWRYAPQQSQSNIRVTVAFESPAR